MNFWQSIWDLFWWTIWIFAFVSYLWAVVAIISDIFRDHELKGWAKAVWVVFLIFVPFLTALIYLIARGGGMAQRAARSASAAQSAADGYIRSVASSNPSDEIAKAKALLDSGAISDDEFATLKAKALA